MSTVGADGDAVLLPLGKVVVGERSRHNLGDVDALASNIADVGLIHALAVRPDGLLLAGRRRLAAVAQLGWEEVPVRVLDTDALAAEDAENQHRLALSPSEQVTMARRIEAKLRPEAKRRIAEGGRRGGQGSGKLPEASAEVAEEAAKRVGTGRRTLDKAKAVVEAAEAQPALYGDLLERMDRTGKVNGCAIELRRRRQAAQLDARAVDAPAGEYDVIVIDPPWRYDDKPADRGLRGATDYATMSLAELEGLEVPAADDCVLWLWITNAMLGEGAHVALLAAWGFVPKTVLTWDKQAIGTGHWLRNITEHCILAVRGKPPMRGGSDSTLLSAKREGHSVKPDAFYTLVERVCAGRRLDMFARRAREGWRSHGLEVE